MSNVGTTENFTGSTSLLTRLESGSATVDVE